MGIPPTPAMQFWILQGGLPAVGLALLISGVLLDLPFVIDLGILALAVAAMASGAACIWTRRIVFSYPNDSEFRLVVMRGQAARFMGAGPVILGLPVAAVGIVHAGGISATAIREVCLSRPGWLLAPGGLAMLAEGIGIIIGFDDARDPEHGALWNMLMSIPSHLGGLILSAIGGGLGAVGLYELLFPNAFDRAVTTLSMGWPIW